jgi:hypothetical protein
MHALLWLLFLFVLVPLTFGLGGWSTGRRRDALRRDYQQRYFDAHIKEEVARVVALEDARLKRVAWRADKFDAFLRWLEARLYARRSSKP